MLLSFINSKRVTLSGESFIPLKLPKQSFLHVELARQLKLTLTLKAFRPIAKAFRGYSVAEKSPLYGHPMRPFLSMGPVTL